MIGPDPGRARIDQLITVLEAELAGKSARSELAQLGEIRIRGLVIIESRPTGATIYLDDRRKGAFARTPWSGELVGTHTIIVDKPGHRASTTSLISEPEKLHILHVELP